MLLTSLSVHVMHTDKMLSILLSSEIGRELHTMFYPLTGGLEKWKSSLLVLVYRPKSYDRYAVLGHFTGN